MSINFGDLSRGLVIELDGQPWVVMDYERHKMQQRAPVTRIKMRNLISGTVIERTFQRYDTAFSIAEVDNRETQYLYTDGTNYFFMDQETFDQHELTAAQLGDALGYLTESMIVQLVLYKGNPINVNLPIHVELKVVDTPPAFRGDTAQGGNKPATLETGLRITVPMFITPGTRVKVDTRNGTYSERVS
jgi:elongation factor P